MPDDKQTNVPDVPWQDAEYKLNGQWLPDVDSSLIGPENYQTLQNLRYGDDTLESVSGYSRVNPNVDELDSYLDIKTGHQLRDTSGYATKTTESYVLVQAEKSDGSTRVYQNRASVGGTQDFEITAASGLKLDVDGNDYFPDNSGATGGSLQGRFSDAPQSNIVYCNGQESMIFGGDEQKIAAAFSVDQTLGAEIITDAHNRDFSDTNEWTNSGMAAFNSSGDLSLTTDDYSDKALLPIANATTVVGTEYVLSFDVANLSGGPRPFLISDNPYTQWIGGVWLEDTGNTVSFTFTATSTGGLSIQNGGTATANSGDFDNFSLKATQPIYAVDVTDNLTRDVSTNTDTDRVTISVADKNTIYFFTTRPIQAFKPYVVTANGTASTMVVKTWLGEGWSDDIINVDGTSASSKSLAQTGIVTLDAHTDSTSKPMHFEELYLYAYSMTLSAGSAVLYHLTVDPAMQSIKDVWDGVYRQPIQFQVLDDTVYHDYTLQVQESSDINAPIGAEIGFLTSSDKLYIMFEERMSAIKFTMLADYINVNTEVISLNYWNGDAWRGLSITDGTLDDDHDTSLSKSGLVSWSPPSGEKAQTLFGSFGYAYEIEFSGTLSVDSNDDVLVDICTGIPAQTTVRGFAWSALYGSRLMLGGHENRVDYSVANAPDVWNGFDSSQDGVQSLYFGGNEATVAGTQIYNRFGANVYSMLLVLKQNEVYILIGDTPEEFTIYPVAKTIGCVSPLSLATAEIGIDLGGGLTRNVAMWLSHSGPMMFDGALLTPIKGIDSYFDPTDSKYIKFSLMSKAAGWIDYNYKEYNIVIPSGSAATENNVWLVYDLAKRKWYEKVPATGHYPQCGFNVIHPTTGQRYNFAGKDDGYMVRLENGNVWEDGSNTGIAQSVTTGDFSPTNNIWDEVTIRKHKLLTKYVAEVAATTNTATIKHYKDIDTTSSTIGTVDLSDRYLNQKLVRSIRNMNKTGVHHAFNYSATTTNVDKGLQPIAWGIQYRQERKENTPT